MRIAEAARRLGTSPRMLRYRDQLGLLPKVREPAPARRVPTPATGGSTGTAGRASSTGTAAGHRRFTDDDIAAVGLGLRIEHRYDITPAALAFGLRVLTEPGVRADVAELGRRLGRIRPAPAQALEFEKERALRLLRLPRGSRPGTVGRDG